MRRRDFLLALTGFLTSAMIPKFLAKAETQGRKMEDDMEMKSVTRPPKLNSGDVVGIAAPALPLSPALENYFKRGLEGISRLGLQVRVAENALLYREHLAIPAQKRADDLNSLFADPEIKAIICIAGGSNANALLPLLDWRAIEHHPKIFMGYSDITCLLMGIYARTGMVTFHGPMILNGFSEFPELLPYTREQMEKVIFKAAPAGALKPPAEWTTDFPKEDSLRQMKPNPGWRWLRPGKAQGWLIGGNLLAMRTLPGTQFWPSFRDAIFFFEEVKLGKPAHGVLYMVDRSLAHLKMLGVFDEISGLVVGKINDLFEEEERLFEQLIVEYTEFYDFPILTQVDFGHTDPRLTLPIGVRASLDSEQGEFRLDESAVS